MRPCSLPPPPTVAPTHVPTVHSLTTPAPASAIACPHAPARRRAPQPSKGCVWTRSRDEHNRSITTIVRTQTQRSEARQARRLAQGACGRGCGPCHRVPGNSDFNSSGRSLRMRREPLSTSPALFLLPLILASSAGATPGATECGTEMMGRIALVTGATGQIGREIALGVARFAAQLREPESCTTYEDGAGLGTQRS